MLTDADLEAMTPIERAQLTARLITRVTPDLFSDRERTERRRFVHVLTACCLAMIPWVGVLAARLPRRYTASHWTLTWVGFDIALGGCLAVTAWSAWRRRQVFVLAATVTASLLGCDLWFDVTTSAGGMDTAVSVASALLVELPLAVVLLHLASGLFRGDVRRSRLLAGDPDPAPSPRRALWATPLHPRRRTTR